MKQVIQLDAQGYFVGVTTADESPLEQGVYMMPANAIDVDAPTVPDGHKVKWNNGWVFEEIPRLEPEVEVDPKADWTYVEYRMSEYPNMADYIDGVVKGDQAQIDAYIAACQAVKAKYPKV